MASSPTPFAWTSSRYSNFLSQFKYIQLGKLASLHCRLRVDSMNLFVSEQNMFFKKSLKCTLKKKIYSYKLFKRLEEYSLS